jgi:hypothetical protein
VSGPRAVAGLALAGLVAAACGSSGSSASGACSASTAFPSAALATTKTDGGRLNVAFRSAPGQPLVAGLDCVELVVTDATSGAAVDQLAITMTPWMPAMGHGASVTPQLTPTGSGHYVFTNVSLPMPGEWQLRTTFSGAVTDGVEPTFDVQ